MLKVIPYISSYTMQNPMSFRQDEIPIVTIIKNIITENKGIIVYLFFKIYIPLSNQEFSRKLYRVCDYSILLI